MEREALETLRLAGFNEYESRVLFALLKLGEADVKTITTYSGVPRTKTYEVLRGLVRKGFVTELSTQPIRFSIPDPDGFIERLKQEKRREVEKLLRELTNLKELLPVLVEGSKQDENYVMKLGNPQDIIKVVEKTEHPRIVVYTRRSEEFLKGLGDEEIQGPIDMILTPSELFLPLSPIGEPRREYVVVVFTNPYIMEMAKRWVDEVLSK